MKRSEAILAISELALSDRFKDSRFCTEAVDSSDAFENRGDLLSHVINHLFEAVASYDRLWTLMIEGDPSGLTPVHERPDASSVPVSKIRPRRDDGKVLLDDGTWGFE